MAFRRNMSPTFRRRIVVQRMPPRRALFWAGIAAAIAVVALAGFLMGLRKAEVDRDYLGVAGERIQVLERELEEVHRQLADAILAHEVDRQVLTIQRQEMTDLQGTVREQREQLAFYRRLMDTSSLVQGPQVADFELLAAEGAGAYRFRLLLTRPTEQGDWTSGSVRLEVAGVQAGDERVLSLAELSEVAAYPLEFRFRYFQRLSGSLTLPDDFRPLKVTVRLALQDEQAGEVERTYDWSPMPE